MTNKVAVFLLRLSTEKLSQKFHNGQYEEVLRRTRRPFSDVDKPTVYRNIFRVLSFFSLGDTRWKSEYGMILKSEQLSLFNKYEIIYLRTYMHEYLNGNPENLDETLGGDFEEVSSRIKSYFPLETPL